MSVVSNDMAELIAMIKNVDIQRIHAFMSEDYKRYLSLNERYDYLSDQYFNRIKTQRETEMDIYSEEYLTKINKGKLNIEQEYGKTT